MITKVRIASNLLEEGYIANILKKKAFSEEKAFKKKVKSYSKSKVFAVARCIRYFESIAVAGVFYFVDLGKITVNGFAFIVYNVV